MLKSIVPARLEFAEGTPYSALYGDVYHSADGGAGQARHVFLQGCGLPGAWAGREAFCILETGFGAGLNFLATWAAWRDDSRRPARLHFLSVEKHPFHADDLARLHAAWPEFAALSRELLANWPMLMPGFHRIALDGGRVQLTLMLGDAQDCIPQLLAGVDAFYLDGFAPDRNADLWQPGLFRELARLAKPGARAATYTVAAVVREGLARAGFVCEKREGYGRKRHCLTASFNPLPMGPRRPAGVEHPEGHKGRARKGALKDSDPLLAKARAESYAIPQHVAVIGAGVAGSAVAHALALRGIRVTVLERASEPAQGASGNPVAVFRPLISRDDNRASRLTRAAFLHNLRAWKALGDAVEWSSCGVLHLSTDDEHAIKLKQALEYNDPPLEFARWVDVSEAARLANWSVTQPGVFYPHGGWVMPASLCRAWLAHPGMEVRYGTAAARLDQTDAGWRVLDAEDAELARAEAVVLANACDAQLLLPQTIFHGHTIPHALQRVADRSPLGQQPWPVACGRMQSIRGQISQLPPGSLPEIRRVISREGYVAPGPDGRAIVGASYEYDNDPNPRTASDEANLARLEHILPGAARGVAVEEVTGRASFRAVMPDRLPLLGSVPYAPQGDSDLLWAKAHARSYAPGLFVAAGYASRGVVWAALLGETLASQICKEPLPLERDLIDAIDPKRFG